MKQKICWPVCLYLVGYHIFLTIALPLSLWFYSPPSWGLLLTSLGLVFASGLAITAGYHRLFSHNSFKAHPLVEALLLFFGSLATQGSALRWCHDHRLHHAFVDTDKDPYSVKKGLFHAHMLWMLYESRSFDPKVVSDLSRKKLLNFQHRHYVFCMLSSNLLVFLGVGWFFQDYWNAFLFAWWVRLFCLHHTTWCINSLAHYWGSKIYSQEHSAVDNYVISLLTYGEGYHNFHHTFAQDYRNGIRWYHFDPTKWIIWTLSKLGLAYNLKKVSDYRIAKQLIQDDRTRLLSSFKKSFSVKKDQIEERISEVSNELMGHLSQLHTLLEESQLSPLKNKDLTQKIRSIKKRVKKDWKEWKLIVKTCAKKGFLRI